MEFNRDVALALLKSEEQFAVDFDDAIKWLGYSRKDSAKRALKSRCIKGFDFHIDVEVVHRRQGGTTKREHIYITVDCLKRLGMMAQTSQGDKVRDYFLQCEAELKRKIEAEKNTTSQPQSVIDSSPTIEEIQQIFEGLLNLGIKPELVESAKLTAVARSIPHLAPAAEEGKKLLSAQMVVEEVPLSPTDLGKAIAAELGLDKTPTPRQINQVLLDAGFQVAQHTVSQSGKKRIQYHLTSTGSEYGQMQIDTAARHGKTIFHPRWFRGIIPAIKHQFL